MLALELLGYYRIMPSHCTGAFKQAGPALSKKKPLFHVFSAGPSELILVATSASVIQ